MLINEIQFKILIVKLLCQWY